MKTAITTVTNIEITSRCSNKCDYCPHPEQHKHREVGDMDIVTYGRALKLVEHCIQKGTQRELNLHGVGEPTMHPHIIKYVEMARKIVPLNIPISINTNGNHMTLELAQGLRDAGISKIDLTAHNARTTERTIKILKKAGIIGSVNMDFATTPNNWGGQIEWTDSVDYQLFCNWLDRGQCMVMSDGNITACCIDAFGAGVFGHLDQDFDTLYTTDFKLCKSCHHEIPDRFKSGLVNARGQAL